MAVASALWSGGRFAFAAAMTARRATTVVALMDLLPRPPERIRGNKWLWAGVACFQPVGPVAYFVVGRGPDPAGQPGAAAPAP